MAASGVLFCLAYIWGLLSTAIWNLPDRSISNVPILQLAFPVLGTLVLGVVAAIAIPRIFRTAPSSRSWLIAGFIAAIAILYLWYRQPSPTASDISQFIKQLEDKPKSEMVTVKGVVKEMPMLTRSYKVRFWLETQQIQLEPDKTEVATGNLYVTVPMLQATGIYPGDEVKISGNLYEPQGAANPNGFSFRAFLAREESFAGFSGKFLSLTSRQFSDAPKWGWWQVRQKIARSHILWLGSPAGQLLSSMVLGSRAVDLPYDIKDKFIATGLAHVLAASGFQVSLLLGALLYITRQYSPKIQFVVGCLGLFIFISLAGWQPAVARAGVMGFGVLLAVLLDRKIKPLGSLLVAATLLLIANPLWIWDLGFQLSFLATFGLVTTVEPITKRLDWLPSTIAALIAVPLAASIWTLPLLFYVFSIFSTYSIFVNVLSTPLVTIISLGGVVSALAAVIYPLAGSAIAYLLNLPLWGLINLVDFFSNVPGNLVAVGKISLVQMLLVYGILVAIWLMPKLQKYWWLVSLGAIAIVLIPNWYYQKQLVQLTLLATSREQVIVFQNQGKVGLIHSSKANTINFTLNPFLQQQGINTIDALVNLKVNAQKLNQKVGKSYTLASDKNQSLTNNQEILTAGQEIDWAGLQLKILDTTMPAFQLSFANKNWLFLGKTDDKEQRQLSQLLPQTNLQNIDALFWLGENLAPNLLQGIETKVAIASANQIAPDTLQRFQQSNTKVYWTGQDGAIQWTPQKSFAATLEQNDSGI
jgi:competence protein ComEC